jgi:hypothetical protein
MKTLLKILRIWSFVPFLCVCVVAMLPTSAKADSGATYAAAMAYCQNVYIPEYAGTDWAQPTSCADGGFNAQSSQCQVNLLGASPQFVITSIGYDCGTKPPPPPTCTAGQVVTPGTNVLQSSTTGEMCTTGANSCEVSLKIGGANSGASVLSGNACSATQGKTQPLPTPSETTNANGTKTYCDNLGNCVTSGPSPPSAPPSASSSANNSTNAASNTDTTPASSASTSGSNGSGSGNGSGTGTGSTGSGNGNGAPASSSSTSTKCTDGVCDVGNADGQVGQLYTPSTDTPASVYASFKAEVSASPLISAATGFFSPPSASGTCPTWHIPGNKYWGEAGFDFTFFCSDGMLALLSLAGILVLAVGAFSAFRIALY